MEKIKVDKVFVLHVKNGYEQRKVHINSLMAKHNISFSYMLDGDIADITPEILDMYFVKEMHSASPATSCELKHIYAMKEMVDNSYENALIFEDDIFLFSDFNRIFNNCMLEFSERTDIQREKALISFENSTLRVIDKSLLRTNTYLYPALENRCTGAYFLTLGAAKAILSDIQQNKSMWPADWLHNVLRDRGLIDIYWCHPPIAEQGSHNGRFSSSIENRKAGPIKRVRWALHKFYKMKIYPLLTSK